jgi:hypothetical protein
LVITLNIVFLVVKFLFLFFVLCYFVSGVCLSFIYLSPAFYIGCAGSVGISLAGRVIYFCVCDSAVWSAGPVQFYSGTLLERMAGLYRLFLFSGSVVAGTVRLKW